MRKEKLNRYEKIMARPDKKRPMRVNEMLKNRFTNFPEALVLKIKILLPDGTSIENTWSEKIADKYSKAKSND